jgi:hypothetical protein
MCCQADPARFNHVKPGRELGNGAHNWLEFANIASNIVISKNDVRAASLRLSTALPDHHALGGSRSSTRHHPVGMHHCS